MDLQLRWKLVQQGTAAQSELFAALGRLQKAEHYLPGRARDGKPAIAAREAWLTKKLQFLRHLEDLTQQRYDAGRIAPQDLYEVQYHRLDVEEDLADSQLGKKAAE